MRLTSDTGFGGSVRIFWLMIIIKIPLIDPRSLRIFEDS
jgi:hypothetical protein